MYVASDEKFCCFFAGPLTEVNLPVDSLTKKIKGFAFITFMMPEHAVKAFTELDGTTFQVCCKFWVLCQELWVIL